MFKLMCLKHILKVAQMLMVKKEVFEQMYDLFPYDGTVLRIVG